MTRLKVKLENIVGSKKLSHVPQACCGIAQPTTARMYYKIRDAI